MLPPGGGGYSLIRALWGHAASQGMFFGIFVLNRVSILSFVVLIKVSILSIFVLKGYLFLDDKQTARIFYEINYSKKIFRV